MNLRNRAMDTEVNSIIDVIKSILVTAKNRLSVTSLLRDYKDMEKQELPFSKFGFCNVVEFLSAYPNHFLVKNYSTDTIVSAILDETMVSISSLVSRTKSKNRQSRFGGTITNGSVSYGRRSKSMGPRFRKGLESLAPQRPSFSGGAGQHLRKSGQSTNSARSPTLNQNDFTTGNRRRSRSSDRVGVQRSSWSGQRSFRSSFSRQNSSTSQDDWDPNYLNDTDREPPGRVAQRNSRAIFNDSGEGGGLRVVASTSSSTDAEVVYDYIGDTFSDDEDEEDDFFLEDSDLAALPPLAANGKVVSKADRFKVGQLLAFGMEDFVTSEEFHARFTKKYSHGLNPRRDYGVGFKEFLIHLEDMIEYKYIPSTKPGRRVDHLVVRANPQFLKKVAHKLPSPSRLSAETSRLIGVRQQMKIHILGSKSLSPELFTSESGKFSKRPDTMEQATRCAQSAIKRLVVCNEVSNVRTSEMRNRSAHARLAVSEYKQRCSKILKHYPAGIEWDKFENAYEDLWAEPLPLNQFNCVSVLDLAVDSELKDVFVEHRIGNMSFLFDPVLYEIWWNYNNPASRSKSLSPESNVEPAPKNIASFDGFVTHCAPESDYGAPPGFDEPTSASCTPSETWVDSGECGSTTFVRSRIVEKNVSESSVSSAHQDFKQLRKILASHYLPGISICDVPKVFEKHSGRALHGSILGSEDFLAHLTPYLGDYFSVTSSENDLVIVPKPTSPGMTPHGVLETDPFTLADMTVPADAVLPCEEYPPMVFPWESGNLHEFGLKDRTLQVIASEVLHPNCLYLQNLETAEHLMKLMTDLRSFYSANLYASRYQPVHRNHLVPMLPCVATFEADDDWHRVLVISVDSLDEIRVFYVDYGTTMKKPANQLAYLKREFFENLSCQSIWCRIYGIEPASGGEWDTCRKVCTAMMDFISDQPMKAELHEIDDQASQLVVDLKRLSSDGRTVLSVSGWLVEQGFAVFANTRAALGSSKSFEFCQDGDDADGVDLEALLDEELDDENDDETDKVGGTAGDGANDSLSRKKPKENSVPTVASSSKDPWLDGVFEQYKNGAFSRSTLVVMAKILSNKRSILFDKIMVQDISNAPMSCLKELGDIELQLKRLSDFCTQQDIDLAAELRGDNHTILTAANIAKSASTSSSKIHNSAVLADCTTASVSDSQNDSQYLPSTTSMLNSNDTLPVTGANCALIQPESFIPTSGCSNKEKSFPSISSSETTFKAVTTLKSSSVPLKSNVSSAKPVPAGLFEKSLSGLFEKSLSTASAVSSDCGSTTEVVSTSAEPTTLAQPPGCRHLVSTELATSSAKTLFSLPVGVITPTTISSLQSESASSSSTLSTSASGLAPLISNLSLGGFEAGAPARPLMQIPPFYHDLTHQQQSQYSIFPSSQQQHQTAAMGFQPQIAGYQNPGQQSREYAQPGSGSLLNAPQQFLVGGAGVSAYQSVPYNALQQQTGAMTNAHAGLVFAQQQQQQQSTLQPSQQFQFMPTPSGLFQAATPNLAIANPPGPTGNAYFAMQPSQHAGSSPASAVYLPNPVVPSSAANFQPFGYYAQQPQYKPG